MIALFIVGGAIAVSLKMHIADEHSMHTGFVVPLVGFVPIAIYGSFWQKLEAKDRRMD